MTLKLFSINVKSVTLFAFIAILFKKLSGTKIYLVAIHKLIYRRRNKIQARVENWMWELKKNAVCCLATSGGRIECRFGLSDSWKASKGYRSYVPSPNISRGETGLSDATSVIKSGGICIIFQLWDRKVSCKSTLSVIWLLILNYLNAFRCQRADKKVPAELTAGLSFLCH